MITRKRLGNPAKVDWKSQNLENSLFMVDFSLAADSASFLGLLVYNLAMIEKFCVSLALDLWPLIKSQLRSNNSMTAAV